MLLDKPSRSAGKRKRCAPSPIAILAKKAVMERMARKPIMQAASPKPGGDYTSQNNRKCAGPRGSIRRVSAAAKLYTACLAHS